VDFRFVRKFAWGVVAAVSACGGGDKGTDPDPPGGGDPASIGVHAGNGQTAAAGSAVSINPAVIVKNDAGQPVAGTAVTFTVDAGGGSIGGSSVSTNASGVASPGQWTLGSAGAQRLSARVGTLAAVFIDATITPGTGTTTATVPATGGTVEITTPEHPYLGLKLTVPAGTYTGNAEFELKVLGNVPLPVMPSGYRVSGPALEVYTPQMRGAKLMTLDIPVTRAANEDVLIALYDPTRRIIEVMPTVGRTPTSVRVMTGHLRADMLVGRPRSVATLRTGEPPAGQVSHSGANPSAYMLQIALSLPLQPVAPVLNPAVDGWPVSDHGSTYFPTGHGPAIPGLVHLGAALSAGLSQKVIPLPRPGFYADAAPLATVVDARRQLSGLTSTIEQMNVAMAGLSKAIRDEMVHHNVVGGMGLTGNSTVVALMPAPGLEPVYANTVSGTETTFSAISPAQAIMNQLIRAVTGGYEPLSVLPSADQPPVTVDGVIPLPSFVFQGVGLSTMSTTLNAPLGSPQREAGNRAMSASAGFPAEGMDLMPVLSGQWRSVNVGTPIAIRDGDAALSLASYWDREFLMNSLIGLAEVARVDLSGPSFVEISSLPDFTAAPELGQVQYVITPTGTMMGGIKQSGSFTITLVKATFKVSPATVDLPANRRVDLVAEVPLPPTGGFRIKWDWGDGTTPTETVNVLTATHTYAQSDDYVVKVTLQENTAGREPLAEQVVAVKGAVAAPFWRILTLSDADNLLGGLHGGGDEEFLALQRVVQDPTAGMISIEQNGNATELRIRAKQTGVWSANDCCPVPGYNPATEWKLPLGFAPAVSHPVGPFFAGWGTSFWNQSTQALDSGTLTGQYVPRVMQYLIFNQGAQTGPAGGFRFSATRNGNMMTGEITVHIWLVDVSGTGEVSGTRVFRLPFTAVRMQ
jgi:hypothetical protein